MCKDFCNTKRLSSIQRLSFQQQEPFSVGLEMRFKSHSGYVKSVKAESFSLFFLVIMYKHVGT